jgi:putative transposase
MMSTMDRWKTSKKAVFNLSYHLIWCPKYRRKVLVDKIKDRLLELPYEKAKNLQAEIIEINIQPDHVHLFIKTKPIHAPQFVVGQLKGYTSRILRKELPTLWTRSYYADNVGNLSEYTIKKYIMEQDKK